MDHVADERCLERAGDAKRIAVRELYRVTLVIVEVVDLLRPNAKRLAERAGESALEAEAGRADDAGEPCRHEGAARLDETLHALGEAVAQHEEARRNYERVAVERRIAVDDIDRDAALPVWAVVGRDDLVVAVLDAVQRALRGLERPVALAVERLLNKKLDYYCKVIYCTHLPKF